MNSYIGLPIVAAVGALWLATPTRAPALTQAPPDQEEPQAGQPRPAELPKPLVIPEAEKNRKNPVPVVPEAIEAGRVTFASQCAMCHGLKGDGRGDLAASLKLKIPDLTTPAIQKKRTDGDWYYIISTGHGQMPGEQRLLPQNRWEMINFMRSLLRPAKTER
jgi:mono/diheme cytochrome c family protein